MSRFLSARLEALQPYTPGEQLGGQKFIKLNANESPYPPSPLVIASLGEREAADLRLYPDSSCSALRQAIADSYGVEKDCVIVGNGSDEILYFALSAFCDSEHGFVCPQITYSFYEVWAALLGVPCVKVPLRQDFTIDVGPYLGCGSTIVIANPNAPTAIALERGEIERIIKDNPDNVVIIDEAYIDFGGESCVPLTKVYDNLLVVQTFSKSRSLAGARLGMAVGNAALINDLDRVRNSFNPYNVDRLALAAGCAAMKSADYYRVARDKIVATRSYTADRLRALGFEMTESSTNFLFVRSDRISGQELYEQLKARGILIRHFPTPELDDYNRITIGSGTEMTALLFAVEKILEGRK